VAIFNDGAERHARALAQNIEQLEGIEALRYRPQVSNVDVGESIGAQLSPIAGVPSYTFVDPFGYKGVSLDLLRRMLSGWGCDLVLFFSYNRISAALTNPNVEKHAQELFGKDRLAQVRSRIAGKRPAERERIILAAFEEALREMGFEFVQPFAFEMQDANRRSHHLIFVTKNATALKIMKGIMAAESSASSQGVPSFAHERKRGGEGQLDLGLDRPLDELKGALLKDFAGRTASVRELIGQHHVGKRYIEKNYRDALRELEAEGKIKTAPSLENRPKRKGEVTFADGVVVSFPKKGT
jgi:three-Cys-motif partner protein